MSYADFAERLIPQIANEIDIADEVAKNPYQSYDADIEATFERLKDSKLPKILGYFATVLHLVKDGKVSIYNLSRYPTGGSKKYNRTVYIREGVFSERAENFIKGYTTNKCSGEIGSYIERFLKENPDELELQKERKRKMTGNDGNSGQSALDQNLAENAGTVAALSGQSPAPPQGGGGAPPAKPPPQGEGGGISLNPADPNGGGTSPTLTDQQKEEIIDRIVGIRGIDNIEETLNNINNTSEFCNQAIVNKIGKERTKNVNLIDFKNAEGQLQHCSKYDPEIAYDNATLLLYDATDEQKKQIEEYRDYLTYVKDTDKKNRAKNGCRSFAVWKYERDRVGKNPYKEYDNEGKDIGYEDDFIKAKEVVETLYEKYITSDHSKYSSILFKTYIERAIDENDLNRNKKEKDHTTWWDHQRLMEKVREEEKKKFKKPSKKILDKFNKLVGNRTFRVIGDMMIHQNNGLNNYSKEVFSFINENHKKDNFQDMVEEIIVETR